MNSAKTEVENPVMTPPEPPIHPRDQWTLVILCLCGFLGIAGFAWQQYRESGQIVDIDEAKRYTNDFVVNINQAGWAEIANLPGIGPNLAKEIVAYRESSGPFLTLEQLLQVNGIGEKKLDQFKAMLAPLMTESSEESTEGN